MARKTSTEPQSHPRDQAPRPSSPGTSPRGAEKSYWTRIGAAWEHKDSKGLSIQLEMVPDETAGWSCGPRTRNRKRKTGGEGP